MLEPILFKSVNKNLYEIVINRPDKANALNKEVLEKIREIFVKIKDSRRVIIIRGAGEKYFSAGADIRSLYNGEFRVIDIHKYFDPIEDYLYPVIALVNGHCFGAACELISACDIRIGSTEALFGIPPARLGLTYSIEGIRRVSKVIGYSRAKLLFLTGKTIDAKEAYRIGLLDYIVEPENIVEYTYRLAEDIASQAPLSLESLKRIFNLLKLTYKDDRIKEMLTDIYKKVLDSEDMVEGLRAFLEKRKPRFRGL